jgi:RraA family protein
MSTPQNEVNELVEAYARSSTAIISDNLAREPGAVGIRPFHRCGSAVAGRAMTVRTRAGDNAAVHKALDLVKSGDFIVVDGGGDLSRAVIGEIMVAIAKSRGAVGFVIDGAIRDVDAIAAGTFPVFAKTAIHRGPYKNGPGEINVPVAIGGLVVHPGDIVVGDGDGIVAFPVEGAKELLAAVHAQEKKEADMLASIANGTYVNAYAK